MSDVNSSSPLESYGISEMEFERALAHSERHVPAGPELEAARPSGLPSAADVAAIPSGVIRALVSAEGYRKTIEFETGGKSYYERKLKKPCWPGAVSGVTIGVGYDVGHHSEKEVEADWGDQLPAAQVEKLLATVGVTGERARGLIGGLTDISVPWEIAEVVFVRATLPKYARLVVQNLLNVKDLHPHSFGALFSLVFNRGPSFYRDGDRYTEMRSIAAHMKARAFDKIPGEIERMKRLWGPELSGLHKRRDAEAALFRKGLDEAARPKDVAVAAPPGGPVVPGTNVPYVPAQTYERALVEAQGAELAGEALEDLLDREAALESAPRRPRPESYKGKWYEDDEVAWVKEDDSSPDYRHIPDRGLAGRAFNFTGRDLELLLEANRFKPARPEGRILFGLRGCQLSGNKPQIDQDSLSLKEARPDHRNFRCVIGVLNTANGRLSAFVASTVPYYTSVHRGWEREANKERPFNGNMLSTGLYPYVVGAHGKRQVPGCFLQGTSFEKRAKVVVLRTHNDVTYDTSDLWHCCVPHDNLHPAFTSTGFSSEGCQTVRGNYSNGVHTADFAALREAAGLGKGKDSGKRFDYVLLTGLEAAIAANLRERGLAADKALVDEQLGRLRQGSEGDEVRRLQKALGRPETGTLDADDRKTLIDRQIAKLKIADAVYSPDWDRELGFSVFAPPPPPVPAFDPQQVAVASLESGRRVVLDDRTSSSLEQEQARARLVALSAASADSLYYEIGLRSQLAAEHGRTGLESGGREFGFKMLKSIGESIFGRVERELHIMLCGGDDRDAAVRDQIAGTLRTMATAKPKVSANGATPPVAAASPPVPDGDAGAESARRETAANIDTLARILVSRLGILPLLAEPLAALLLDQVFKATLADTCDAWAARLGPAPGAGTESSRIQLESVAPLAPARIAPLLDMPESQLLEAIERASPRVTGAGGRELALEGFPSLPAIMSGGRLIYNMAESQLFTMLCNEDETARAYREHLGGLFNMPGLSDRASVASGLATLLVTHLGFLPMVAVPIAALLVSRVFKSGFDDACKYWGAARSQGRPA